MYPSAVNDLHSNLYSNKIHFLKNKKRALLFFNKFFKIQTNVHIRLECECVCLCLHDLRAKQIWQTAERKAGKKQTQIKQQIKEEQEEEEEERKRGADEGSKRNPRD